MTQLLFFGATEKTSTLRARVFVCLCMCVRSGVTELLVITMETLAVIIVEVFGEMTAMFVLSGYFKVSCGQPFVTSDFLAACTN